MLHEVTAVESRRAELRLNSEQVQSLLLLGRELAAGQAWWGDDPEVGPKSVIEAIRLAHDSYAVTFRDVVGVVRLGDIQIRIRPKIPDHHFSYLIAKGALAPRTSVASVGVSGGEDYASLLASWCVTEAESLLRRGLRADYIGLTEELPEVRGRLDVVATALAIQSGRPTAACEFEEFSDNSSLNRIVKAACQRIAATPGLATEVRHRARRVVLRMEGVGHLLHVDRMARVTRLTKDYERALPLAHLVLRAAGVAPNIGRLSGRAFLVRTPEIIEDGLRSLLSSRLAPVEVRKRRISIGASGFTMNPDLVFGEGVAVADVKYRYFSDKWHRASLYQAVAFAAAFRCQSCAILGFAGSGGQTPASVSVGDIVARAFAWDADGDADPSASADRLVGEVGQWLAETNSGAHTAR